MNTDAHDKAGFYTISAIARLLNVHQQTLRLYEKRNLVSPSRTKGNTRLYSAQDLDRIRFIVRLTDEMGVNLNGVEIILNLRDSIERMQDERIKIEKLLIDLLRVAWSMDHERVANSIMPASIAELVRYHDISYSSENDQIDILEIERNDPSSATEEAPQ